MPNLLELSSKEESLANLLRDSKLTSTPPTIKPVATQGPPERKTFKIESNLLSRLEAFLPQIRDANAALEEQIKKDPKAVDIENVDEESGGQYIEMDLGLGVYDLKKDASEEELVIPTSASTTTTAPVAAGAQKKPLIQMMDIVEPSANDTPTTTATKDTDKDGEDIVMA